MCAKVFLCFFPSIHVRRVGVGVDGANIMFAVVADFIAGAICVMRPCGLYPFGILVNADYDP